MPASNVVVSRSLQVGADERALTYVELDPTMTQQFRAENVLVTNNLLWQKPLPTGAMSVDFPIYGINDLTTKRHAPGQRIEGQQTVKGKTNVSIDDPLLWCIEIPLVDKENTKWDAIEPEAKNIARADAEWIDKVGWLMHVKAARTAAAAGLHDGGLRIVYQDTAGGADGTLEHAYPITEAGGDLLCNHLNRAGLLADTRNWPRDPRKRLMGISAHGIAVLTESKKVTSRDFIGDNSKPILDRNYPQLYGWTLVPTNHLPSGAVPFDDLAKYQQVCDGTSSANARPIAVGMLNMGERGAVGMIDGPQYDKVVPDERYDTTMIKRRRVTGLAVVEPWKAIEIATYF